MVIQVKRILIESDETHVELFGKDSDEEFEGLYIVGDEKEGFA